MGEGFSFGVFFVVICLLESRGLCGCKCWVFLGRIFIVSSLRGFRFVFYFVLGSCGVWLVLGVSFRVVF